MTTNVQQLELIKATIDTQYTLARIELFRPFEIFDRYHGIKASEMPHPPPAVTCGKIEFHSTDATNITFSDDEWEQLESRAEQIDAIAAGTHHCSADIYQNVAECPCGQRVVVYSVRVSITWNGRTLMREYVLPDLERPTKEACLSG